MNKIKIPEGVQKEVRRHNLDELYILFGGVSKNNKYDRDNKIALLAYLEKRIKKLQKQNDYEDKNMSDKEFVTKWGK